jgi:hypothetical protein
MGNVRVTIGVLAMSPVRQANRSKSVLLAKKAAYGATSQAVKTLPQFVGPLDAGTQRRFQDGAAPSRRVAGLSVAPNKR